MSYLTPQQALHLAMEHHRAGRLAEAEDLYQQLLHAEPQNADLVQLLGLAAYHRRDFTRGRELIGQAIAMNPNVAHYHNNLGTLFLDRREFAQASAAYAEAVRLDPQDAGIWYNIGVVCAEQRQWPAAIEAYRTSLKFNPDYPACALNLGIALSATGQIDEAIVFYRAELRRRPQDGTIATNLGNLLKDRGELDAAIESYRGALALRPDDAITINNLAVTLKDQGQIEDSIAAFRHSLALRPAQAEIRSNLILTMFFDPRTTPTLIEDEQREWNRRHVAPLRAAWSPHPNDRVPERRLRIGYVSPDLRDHVVGRALLPVFEQHDREQVEVVCYSNSPADHVTQRFQARADLWRDAQHLSDDQLAQQIREDRIDVLVDLALHTSDNRLGAFARKPAPLQVSWLGYPGSTGLDTIDYRLTDSLLDPTGSEVSASGERPFPLPDCWSCYAPPAGSPLVSELPARTRGFVTFGSLNNFCKVNARLLDLWAEILNAAVGSRLLLLTKFGRHRSWVRDFLRERGIAAERIEFLGYAPLNERRPPAEFLRRYERIDIALDTAPYHGMTTTCDALWMGVPVVSLIGKLSLGRAGLSLLSNVGLAEFATATEAEYVRAAVALARDLPRLAALRASLRERMANSPLLDAPRLAKNVEDAFRVMWRTWCAAHP